MAKKAKAKLTPVPRPRRAPKAEAAQKADGGAPPADPLAHISESLRPLAVPIGDVAFMVGNAVKHPEKQLQQIEASLRAYGQVDPIIVNRRESPPTVIGGNGRLAVALRLNWQFVAVAFVDLDRAKANALSLALNRTSDGREWDSPALDALLRDLDTGNDPHLDAMLADLAADVGLVPPGELPPPAPRQKKPVTCPGCGLEFRPGQENADA